MDRPLPRGFKRPEGKPEDHYYVSNIVDHKIEKGQVYYRIRWLYFTEDDDTWEPQQNLDGSLNTLTKYHRTHPDLKILDPIFIQNRVGFCEDEAAYNHDVWTTTASIIKEFKRLNRYDIGIADFDMDPNLERTGIVLVAIEFHLYTCLFIKETKELFVADGRNKIHEIETQNDIRTYIKDASVDFKLYPLSFERLLCMVRGRV